MYETGLGVAFLLWIAFTVNTLVMINSTLERNLNKVGQRLSWVSLRPCEMTEADLKRSWLVKVLRFSLIAAVGLVSVLLSWLYVAWAVGLFLYRYHKDSGAPQSVKEYRWKMRNLDLPFVQIIREGMKLADVDPDSFETVRSELIEEMEGRGLRVGRAV